MSDSTPEDIKNFITQMKDRHSSRLQEQRTDQTFLKNNYALVLIKKQEYQMRTNFAARMINAITQQLISNKPKAYISPRADSDAAKTSSKKISILLNKWIVNLLHQPSNPFEQTFKNFNYRGDSWLYTPHNALLANYGEGWRKDFPEILPAHFIMYDPMVVFSEPNEEVDGEPARVLVEFERDVSDVQQFYPEWSNPGNGSKKAIFTLYFDKKRSYAEAAGEPLFRDKKKKLIQGTGERENLYGCIPFVHMYSGWGFEDEKRDPELLSYSRIRMLRDLITEDSQVRSDQMYNFHTFAHKSKTLYIPAGQETSADWDAAYKNEPDKLNLIHLPEGANPDWFKVEDSQLFDASAFAYADRVRSDLGQEYPAPLRGAGGTSSGREANILSGNAVAIYDCAVSNTSLLWAKGFMKALRVLSSMEMLPEGINEDDIKRIGEVDIDMRTDDPVERDRDIKMGEIAVNAGHRSLKRHLMEDWRMTEEEAEDEIDNILTERIMLQSPEIAQFLGFKAAEKSGMAEELRAYLETQANTKQVKTGNQIGSKGGEPRQGNIKTETGMEQMDVSNSAYGQRSPMAV